jgi:hypothetical protein
LNFIFYSEDFFFRDSVFSQIMFGFFPLAHFTLGCNSIINSCCVSFTQLWRSLKNTKNDDSEIEIVSRILRSEILDDFSTSVVNYSQRFRKQWVKVIEKCFSFFPFSWTFQPVTKTRSSSKAFQFRTANETWLSNAFWSVYFCKVVLGSSLIKHLVSN